jgi:hypothetical protein
MPCPAAPFGYGESKYLAEQLLTYYTAATTTTQNLNPGRRPGRWGVIRIGQVAGTACSTTATGPRGWNKTEWLPGLVLSSLHLGVLPGELGVMDEVDWVPVDELVEVVVELSFSLRFAGPKSKAGHGDIGDDDGGGYGGGNDGLEVFHCVNPHPIPWRDLVPVVVRVLSASRGSGNGGNGSRGEDGEQGGGISVVGFGDWLDRLESSASTAAGTASNNKGDGSSSFGADLERNPALKLLDFYRRLDKDSAEDGQQVRLSLEKTVRVSPTLAKLGPIQPEWMAGWIQDWLKH